MAIKALTFGLAVFGVVAGCEAEAPPSAVTPPQLEALSDLGIAAVSQVESDLWLFDANGDAVGAAEVTPLGFNVRLDPNQDPATLERVGSTAAIQCSKLDEPSFVHAPANLEAWIESADLEPECIRALQVGQIIAEVSLGDAEDLVAPANFTAASDVQASCQGDCDATWSTCVDYAGDRYECCLDHCAGPMQCSLCPFWERTDVLVCSWQRCECITQTCMGLPPGTCGPSLVVTGQSPPSPCYGI